MFILYIKDPITFLISLINNVYLYYPWTYEIIELAQNYEIDEYLSFNVF